MNCECGHSVGDHLHKDLGSNISKHTHCFMNGCNCAQFSDLTSKNKMNYQSCNNQIDKLLSFDGGLTGFQLCLECHRPSLKETGR